MHSIQYAQNFDMAVTIIPVTWNIKHKLAKNLCKSFHTAIDVIALHYEVHLNTVTRKTFQVHQEY